MKLEQFVIFSVDTIRIIFQHSVTPLAGLTVHVCQRLMGSQLNSSEVGQDFGCFYFHSTNN